MLAAKRLTAHSVEYLAEYAIEQCFQYCILPMSKTWMANSNPNKAGPMNVTVYRSKVLRMSKANATKVEEAKTKGLCLMCERPSVNRGLCNGCYQAARRMIRAGQITEDELVVEGKMLQRDETQTGRPPSNPLTKSVRNAS